MTIGRSTLTRRRFLTFVIAAPTLTVAVHAVDGWLGPAPAAASPQVSDVVDLSDALTLAALPTAYLLKIEITAADRVVVHVPRAEVGQGITTAMGIVAAEELDAGLETVDVVLDDARPELLVEPAHRRVELGALAVHADADGRGRDTGAARHRGRAALGASTRRRSRRTTPRWSRPTGAPRRTDRCRPTPRRSSCPRFPRRRRIRASSR